MTAFDTRAVHTGQAPDPVTGAVIPPLYLSTTFRMNRVGEPTAGYDYTRSGNPTRDSLQQAIAALERARRAFTFSSGLAAEDALLRVLLEPGDAIVYGNDAYGGTFRLIDKVYRSWHVSSTAIDLTDLDGARETLTAMRPRVVWAETPSNPLLNVVDIAAIAELAHGVGAALVIDNTFASPVLQNPLDLGADAVVHSTTKYIAGHSDAVGGAVAVNGEDLIEHLAFIQNSVGTGSAPFDSWLTNRGLKTLGVRVRQASATAGVLAERLRAEPAVAEVVYPGLPEHPGHAVAARQMRGFGGILSLRIRGGADAARAVVEHTELFALAVSLGAVESLIEYPYAMTHAATQGSSIEAPHDLIRLSIGLEDPDDLLADLQQAFAAAHHPAPIAARA
jgi:cystathionine gamma-synthase